MCEKCFRKGKKHKIRTGLLNYLSAQFDRGYSIPIFYDKASNFYIEGQLWRIHREKTNKKKYSRKGRRNDNVRW